MLSPDSRRVARPTLPPPQVLANAVHDMRCTGVTGRWAIRNTGTGHGNVEKRRGTRGCEKTGHDPAYRSTAAARVFERTKSVRNDVGRRDAAHWRETGGGRRRAPRPGVRWLSITADSRRIGFLRERRRSIPGSGAGARLSGDLSQIGDASLQLFHVHQRTRLPGIAACAWGHPSESWPGSRDAPRAGKAFNTAFERQFRHERSVPRTPGGGPKSRQRWRSRTGRRHPENP